MRRSLITLVFAIATVIASLCSAVGFGQNSTQYYFKSLTVDDGLTHGVVTAITQDDFGFMWFGTLDGLNRYDGSKFINYSKSDSIPYPIGSNHITCLQKAPDGKIWIGTWNAGLYRLDPRLQKFEALELPMEFREKYGNSKITGISIIDHFLYASFENSAWLMHNLHNDENQVFEVEYPEKPGHELIINSIAYQHGTIWLATKNAGIVGVKPGEAVVQHYNNSSEEPEVNYETTIKITPLDFPFLILATHDQHLHKLNTKTGESEYIRTAPSKKHHLASCPALLRQGKDSLWIGTIMCGLHLYHIPKDSLELISIEEYPGGINYNSINTLYRGQENILWLGTNGKGINYHTPINQQFKSFSSELKSHYKLDFESVRSVSTDKEWLYIGGYLGFNKINTLTGSRSFHLDGIPIYTQCQVENNKDLLILGVEGTYHYLYNKKTEELSRIYIEVTNQSGKSYKGEHIFDIMHLTENTYLMACIKGLMIIDIYKPKEGLILEHEPGNPNSLVDGEIKTLFRDQENNIWVGSRKKGFMILNESDLTFSPIKAIYPGAPDLSDGVNCINQDQNSNFWFGTNTGLVFFNPVSKKHKHYSLQDGLPNDLVCGVVDDLEGNIWVSTNNGIACFNTKTENFRVYTKHQGLPGNQYHRGSTYKSDSGTIYFCGYDGMVSFTPEDLDWELPRLKPILVNCRVNNQILQTDTLLPYKRSLEIKPDQNFIIFELSGMNYLYTEKEYFQYRIPEKSGKWIDLGQNNIFQLGDQKHGIYTIEIRASVNQIDWISSPHPLKLNIKAEFPETTAFKILIIGILTFFILLIIYLRFVFLRQQKNRLNLLFNSRTLELEQKGTELIKEIEQRKQTEQQLLDANSTKDKFFSIIAHDLRSPFSSLLGITSILNQEWDEYSESKKLEFVSLIRKNLENTYRLLINLLDWSRLQRGIIKPVFDNIDLFLLVEKVIVEVGPEAANKNIMISNFVPGSHKAFADAFMVSTLFRNLVSNAIKFTPTNGQIQISASVEDSMVTCCVKDTGVGMNEEVLSHLFSMNQQSLKKGTQGEKGTGLGLIVCKEFVQLLGGELTVISSPEGGSTFCFTLKEDS
ncbi:MAG: hypothetical protein HOK84_08395 [Bacteroidetes bacterium]|nr:hypothetical protein [Bacteroidota bacterium]